MARDQNAGKIRNEIQIFQKEEKNNPGTNGPN